MSATVKKIVPLVLAIITLAVIVVVGMQSDQSAVAPPAEPSEPVADRADQDSSLGSSGAMNAPPNLVGTSWVWQETEYAAGDMVTPDQRGSFVLSFVNEAQYGSQTDCNTVRGTYAISGNEISFSQEVATEMACRNNTQEEQYLEMLAAAELVEVNERGELLLRLPEEAATMVFTNL
jgi:heat shock protein HslJ